MIKIKKLIRGVIVSAAAACMLSIAAFAYTGTGTVNVSNYLNVRQSSSTSSAIIGKLYNGTKVDIIDSAAGFYKISYNGTTGWVSSSYVAVSTGTVNVGTYLNVRKSNSTSSEIIGKLYNGTKVNIIDSAAGFYKISYNGITGWASSNYITADSSTKIQTVVSAAKSVIGVKYVFGAASPSAGFDCSGLTMYAYSKAGISLPHSAAAQSTMGTWVAKSNLRPGDLIFFDTAGSGNITHVGMYIGNDTFIQAESGSVQKVTTTSLSNSYWSGVYITARRFIQ